MVVTIYIVILIYFLIGGSGFYFINKKRKHDEAQQNKVKYISYFIIINVIFFSIVIYPAIFSVLSVLILIAGLYELIELFRMSGYQGKLKFSASLVIFIIFAFFFFIFSGRNQNVLLFTFLIVSIFDSFSQITGQLWGRIKLVPCISPGKTIEGLVGGIVISLISAVLLRNMLLLSIPEILTLSLCIVLFAFAGDLLASSYKRIYKVKDYSNLIPGHGGFLDRFDSLIAGGASVSLLMASGLFNHL